MERAARCLGDACIFAEVMLEISFERKVVFISGAASGFGKLAAERFYEGGARLVLVDLNLEALLQASAGFGDRAIALQCDVTSSEQLVSVFEQIRAKWGVLHIAVNNAGKAQELKNLEQLSDTEWQQMIDINLSGVFFAMREQIKMMLAHGSGVIVNVASVAGVLGAPGLGAYGAAKHGVVGLTRTAAVEHAADGIRVNAVCPGFSETPMMTAIRDSASGDLDTSATSRIPMGRISTPEEIVQALLWLCSEANSFMTGSSVVLDGGLTAS